MADRMAEIDNLDKHIKNAEISLGSIMIAIEKIDKEISILSPRKTELEQNIEFHKRSETIPLAHEYKKAKAELLRAKARLISITFDRKKAAQACLDIKEIIEKLKRDHTKLAEIGHNNVLRVNFWAHRNGKK